MSSRRKTADTDAVLQKDEVRQHIARVLELHSTSITTDAIRLSAYAGLDAADELSSQFADLIIGILVGAIQDADVDARSREVADLRRVAREKRLPIRQLFGLVYLLERAILDELALDESFGATSEPWPSIAQIVRRASFDVLGAFVERLGQEAGDESLIDPLTTLHTRSVLVAAIEKEIQRAERSGHPFALIVFDVDRLSEINATHGYGFGDRVLERIGIVIRNYFREQDWVSRSSGDTFGVLLPETPRAHAEQLAERVRETVQERMSLRDHRSDSPVLVTVSAAVVIAQAVDSSVRAESLIKEAEQAVHRAKHSGRNRVERVEINVKAQLPPSRGAQGL
jgi:diguanylate cyclase (GGDEF)-like protein